MCDLSSLVESAFAWFTGTKDFWQATALCVATIGGPITAWLAIREARENRAQRTRDLRWKQAELARQLSEEIWKTADSRFALEMIDFRRRNFTLPSQEIIRIDEAQVLAALKTDAEPTRRGRRFYPRLL
jgi:hypothetical protein